MALHRNKKIIFLFLFLSIIIIFDIRKQNPYDGNTWGKEMVVLSEDYVYLDKSGEMNVYRINKDSLVYCSKNESFTRLFCWFIFDVDQEPISGWIKKESLERK